MRGDDKQMANVRSKQEMGEIVFARRKALGLTRVDMNAKLGYSYHGGMIKKIENGEQYIPLDRLRDYAEILQVPVETLVP